MEEVELYRKNNIDCYAFLYFPEGEYAEAVHMIIPTIGQTVGTGRPVIKLEGIKSREEAIKKLKEAVDKIK